MREPVGYLWTEKANGEKSLRFAPPADLPYNREHWEWEPVYVGNDDPAGLPSRDSGGPVSIGPDQQDLMGEPATWPIDTDDQVEALARECDWDNRKYMTPKDYAIWCERMRKFARLAGPSAPASKQEVRS